MLNTRELWRAVLIIALFFPLNVVYAGEADVVGVEVKRTGKNIYYFSVTVHHNDTGWDHYADNWRVVDDEGNVLGDRVLYHPHVDEQPFTRGLSGVRVPEGITTIYIEAHDKVHGWTPNRLKVDLNKAIDGHLRVE